MDNSGSISQVLSNKRVLLVDDDIRNIYSITAALEALGLTVEHAQTGDAAIRYLHTKVSSDFDMMFMDIMMPDMNGFEVITHLRKDPKWKSTPIIAFSADPDYRHNIEGSGATAFLSKPLTLNKLQTTIEANLVLS